MQVDDDMERTTDDSSQSFSDSDVEINPNRSLSEDSIFEGQVNEASSSDSENIIFDEESSDSENNENEEQNKDKYDALRIEQVLHDVRLYPNSEATVDETVLELVQMYVERECTKNLLSYTLNMMLKTMPKNHNFPSSIYKLFQYVKNVAPRFTSIEHFYCNNVDCMLYIGTHKMQCESCSDNAGLESFYEIDIAEQIEHMFLYRDLAENSELILRIKIVTM